MKILLIRHHYSGNVNTRSPHSLNRVMGNTGPIGITYIDSALLNANYKVAILDSLAEGLTVKETQERIKNEKPDIVGITAMTPTVKGALEAARLAKEYGAITVMGGPQISVLPQETLMHDFIDFGIIGEGETPMVNLAKALESKQSFSGILGLVYKENGKIHINQPNIEFDLDSISFPARHLLPMKLYNSIITVGATTTMISSRGCPYQCGFCVKQPADKKIRFRYPKLIVDEIEETKERYHIKEFMFYDDTLTLRRQHINSICEEILRRGLDICWIAPTRVDHVDLELLRLMKRAGCRQLRYGVESGNQHILDLMQKKINLKQVRDAFRWSRQVGIETLAFFILAYPTETKETIRETISFAKEINPDLVEFLLASPLPETEMFEYAVKEGIVDRDYWRDFTLLKRSDPIPYFLNDAEKYLAYAYRSFFFRPCYIVRRLKRINSLDSFAKHIRGAYAFLNFHMRPK